MYLNFRARAVMFTHEMNNQFNLQNIMETHSIKINYPKYPTLNQIV